MNYLINACVIKDRRNRVEVYYLPTSLVNRKDFFEYMKGLYGLGGSLTFLVASTGVSSDVYLNILDEEIDNNIFQKYLPHLTNATLSKDDAVTGRPKTDDPSENTIKSQNNDGNNMPKPSTS